MSKEAAATTQPMRVAKVTATTRSEVFIITESLKVNSSSVVK